ncbi:hypothetical protein [Candidatus Solincola sp.]|jgi:hypothetical protein|nr:hypothetical protein [Actinomycetota bacterium]MDI7251549.1 hypothetical protein [Actinomycetota bacterium]
MERVKNLEEWVKSARAQAGTFSHGRGDTGSLLSGGKELIRKLEDLMLRRRGAEITAAAILFLVTCTNYLRGRMASRRTKRIRLRL